MNRTNALITNNQTSPTYFETQRGALCAVHAINNVFQDNLFDEFVFDDAVDEVRKRSLQYNIPPPILDSQNPNDDFDDDYNDVKGGNYNIQTIQVVLESIHYELRIIKLDELEVHCGNNSMPTGMYLIRKRFPDHWFVLQKFHDAGPLWLIDSKMSGSVRVDNLRNIFGYIDRCKFKWNMVYEIVHKPSDKVPSPASTESVSDIQIIGNIATENRPQSNKSANTDPLTTSSSSILENQAEKPLLQQKYVHSLQARKPECLSLECSEDFCPYKGANISHLNRHEQLHIHPDNRPITYKYEYHKCDFCNFWTTMAHIITHEAMHRLQTARANNVNIDIKKIVDQSILLSKISHGLIQNEV